MKSSAAIRPPKLSLSTLGKGRGLPALTVARGKAMAEAASVCFARQKHVSPVPLSVAGSFTENVSLAYPKVTEQMRRGNADIQEAGEHGAYGVSFVLGLHLTGYTVVERSRKGTGFDYSLGIHSDVLPFQQIVRLEVSSICESPNETVADRVKAKRRQISRSDGSGLKGLIIVVDFRSALAQVEWR